MVKLTVKKLSPIQETKTILNPNFKKIAWRGMWDLNPRGLSTTDLAGLPPTRLGQSRTEMFVVLSLFPVQFGVLLLIEHHIDQLLQLH